MTREEFEEQVEEALELVPEEFRAYLKDVAVVVEDWPPVEHRHRLRLRPNETLFGLYEGVPLTQRTPSSYNLALPDRITLFQGPLEADAGPDRERLRRQVRRVVLHEIAHHFGFGEERLRELGY
jgi:predicted Zn-dependent protease with MMP-like domain